MKFLSVFSRTRKSVLLILPLLLVASYAVHDATGYSYGITGRSKIGCGGGGCHGAQSPNTVISISSASTQLVAGQTYVFRISVANPNEKAAGCDISVDNGAKLDTIGRTSGLWSDYGSTDLTHTMPQYFGSTDSATWTFKYIAPSKVGTAHIYAAGNAVNGDYAADAQDHWNLAVDTLTIAAAGVAPGAISSTDLRLFPNPSTTGRLTLVSSGLAGVASVAISDPTGKIVLRESLRLGGDSPLDLSALPNGIYFLSIRATDGQSFMRRIVIDR